ncbi:hypothetical protein IE077_000909 [Cardiosporidium cionae]|uniref:Pre-rRNA-processing protein TSR2 homolog n=1 Tax=Cardiosporidium cionae TaxID=476202 RepID=A0ABQ7J6C5_9APIC|nr:hypothetical protein IE077_000909 [Cardiosporidium cionae]|eukprot:KAF8819513.1 hypothetical protein IE077_000909 [Cardiosporidium cionae]
MDERGFQLFTNAVAKALNSWTALNLAVEYQWGGRFSHQKRETLGEEIISYFTDRKTVKTGWLAETLATRLSDLFSVDLEDHSEEEVAALLVNLYDTCKKGDYSLVEQISKVKSSPADDCVTSHLSVESSASSLASDIEMEESEEEDVSSAVFLSENPPSVPQQLKSSTKVNGNTVISTPIEEDGWIAARLFNRRKK